MVASSAANPDFKAKPQGRLAADERTIATCTDLPVAFEIIRTSF
jgi:hypothetical protein